MTGRVLKCPDSMDISTHTLTWSVTPFECLQNIDTGISTHTLTWSVTACCRRCRLGFFISTHTLTWSVTPLMGILLLASIYFNSHAHVERDRVGGHVSTEYMISTHTLTWSVTTGYIVALKKNIISTHTLTWSVTRCRISPIHTQRISTHTLTWSVTGREFVAKLSSQNFNSHAHVERDLERSTLR